MTIDNNPLLKERAAADRLGVCASTLRRWRWAGYGPEWIKLGGAVRYAPEALARFIAVCQRPVPERSNMLANTDDQQLTSCN